MAFKHTIHEDYIHIEWYGELTRSDLQELGSLIPELGFKMGYAPNVLHTFDAVTSASLQPWDAFQHSLRIEDARLPNRAKSASVAKHPAALAMASLFQELNRNPMLVMETFNTEEEAITWLRNRNS